MNIKFIFTWWNKQTFGTYLKTLFTGKYIGKDEFGNKYYSNKKNERWVVYSGVVEATKITSEWYLWMHRTTDKIPDNQETKYSWQKKHIENNESCEILRFRAIPQARHRRIGGLHRIPKSHYFLCVFLESHLTNLTNLIILCVFF